MKIFIIDDDYLSIFLTENLLVFDNPLHEIKTFISGTEALKALQTGNEESIPDIIFLDLNMPVMDGWEFLDELATFGPAFCSKCSIYILTSSLDVSDTARSNDYVLVSGLIHKPLTTEDIEMHVYSLKS